MRLNGEVRDLRLFAISPRTPELHDYWRDVMQTTQWCEQYEYDGMLIFTGNDVYVDPWSVAQVLLERTHRLSPLIAVNPLYMHPFTAARMVASFTYLYQRKIFLNMVTGTALSHLHALGDTINHDERYDRLLEYIQIIKQLCEESRPLSFDGRFYTIRNLQLPTPIPRDLLPVFVLAGQSEAARRVCFETGAISMAMLSAKLEEKIVPGSGVHFGIITRESAEEAWEAARSLFPPDVEGREILEASMLNTDSSWKMRMKFEADEHQALDTGYWLEPFRAFKADCPYFVGSHDRVATLIENFVRKGVEMLILDIPANEDEYRNLEQMFHLAQKRLATVTIETAFSGDC